MHTTAVKSLGPDRVGGYLVVWGDALRKDLHGEYFTPETDLALAWYARRPVLYHHGLDGTLKAALVGVIDTLRADETGLWAEAQLDLRQRYVQAVRPWWNVGRWPGVPAACPIWWTWPGMGASNAGPSSRAA